MYKSFISFGALSILSIILLITLVLLTPKKCKKITPKYPKPDLSKELSSFFCLLDNSKNPILVLGYGVILSKSETLVRDFIIKNNLRCVTTWTAAGIFSSEDKHNLGIIGMSGQAGANKVVFNTDLLIW